MASIWVSLSRIKSLVGTGTLYVPSALTSPMKVLLLTVSVTLSPTLNSPVTLPVTAIVALLDSVALMMLSSLTGFMLKAVPLPVGVSMA